MQLKKFFLLLLLAFSFFVGASATKAASSCSGQFGSWCGPQSSNENCCTAEQCTGSSCSSTYPGCGQYGANARIGQCDYKCLEGVLRLVQCDHNYAIGTSCSSSISNGQDVDIGYCNYYCGHGTLQVNRCSSPIQSNSLEGDNYLCHSDGTCIGSLLPGDSGCRYRVFNGQAVREYSRIWTEAMCPPASTNPADLTCTDGNGVEHQDGTWWEEGGCARQCDAGTTIPSVCPLDQCYIAPKYLGGVHIEGKYVDSGTLASLGGAECDPVCPQNQYDAWACTGTCYDGSWTDVYDCQYKVPYELNSCTATCPYDAWSCNCPTECSQSTATPNDTCGGLAPLGCGIHPDNTIWNEDFCNYRCDNGVTTKIESSCSYPNGHVCEPSMPEQCISQYCGYDERIDIYTCENEPQPDLSCKIGNGTLANGESSYYSSSICAPYCTDSTNEPATTCLLKCTNGNVSVDQSGGCVYPRTQLDSCTETCTANAGCVCSNTCNISGDIVKGENCGGSLPQDCEFIAHGETGSTGGQNCYDGGCQTNLNGSPPTSCSVTCNDGDYTNATACVYPKKSLGSCDATCNATFGCSCPSQCTNSNISLNQSCGGVPYDNCSIDGFSDLAHGNTGHYFTFTDSGGTHTPCANFCTNSTNLDATSCNLSCNDGSLSLVANSCVYPRTPLDTCTQICTASAGCICPDNCAKEGNIAQYAACGGDVRQDCPLAADGQKATLTSQSCYDAGCTVNANGPLPSSCSVTCNDGDYTNATACVYPKKSLGSCDATCNATFGCSCPNICTNDEISNGQSCGGIPYESCSIDGYADLEHGDTKHYFSYIDILGLHDPCANYCTNQTNLPAVGCYLSCNDGGLNLVSNSCEYPKTPLNTCTQTCTADAGCTCPDNCVKEGNITKNTNCGGYVRQDCDLAADGQKATLTSARCYDAGCEVNTNGEVPSSCTATCSDGEYINATACVYPKKSLGSCDATCNATFGCSCPNICTNDEISNGQSCGGELHPACKIEGYSDLEHGETGFYFNYTDALGEHTPCTAHCTNQTNLPATECYLSCADGQLSLRDNSDSACTYPQTPLENCTDECTADAGCTCSEECYETGSIEKGGTCGDPIPNCTAIATSRCSLDGDYSEYCLIPGLDPITRTYCKYQCNAETHKCNLAPLGAVCTASSECQSDICYEGICTNAIGGTEPSPTPTPNAYCPDYNDNREYCEQVEGCEYKTETNKCVPSGSPTYCDIESPGICGGTLYDCATLHGFEDTCNAISGCTYNTDEGTCLNEPETAVGTWCPTPSNEPAVCLPNPDLAGSQYSGVCACINEYGDDVLKPYGIPCDENSECYSNYCAPQSPTRPEYKTCIDRPVPEPFPEPIAADEPCRRSSAYLCESRICEPKEEQDLLCVTACTIQTLTTEELNACIDDCNVTEYVCAEKPPKSAGQICTLDEECESLMCSGNEVTPGVCEPIIECTTHERCREYFGSEAYGCNVSQRMCERTQTPAPPPATSDVFCPALSLEECEKQSVCEFRVFESTPNPGGIIDPIPGAGVCVNRNWPQSCDNLYSSSACRYEDSNVDHGKYMGDTCSLTTSENAYCVPSEREENGDIAYYNVCYCSNTSGIENYQVFAKQFCPSNAKFACQCLHDNLNLGHVSNIAPGEYCSPTIEREVLCSATEHGESCWCPSMEGHGILVPIESNLILAGEVCGKCNPDVILSCLDEAIAEGNLAAIFEEIGTAFMFGFNRSEAGQEFANNIVNHMFDDSKSTPERIAIAIEDGMNLAVNLLTFWGVETTFNLTVEMQACLDTNRDQILGSAPESDSVIAAMSSAFEQTISLCGGQIVSAYISGVLTSIDIGQIGKGILNSFNGAKLAEQLVEKIEPRLLRIGWVADIVDNAPYIKPHELLRLADEAGISVSDAFTFANTKNLINSNIIKYQFGDSISVLIDDVIRYSIQNLERLSIETLENMSRTGVKLTLEQFNQIVDNSLLNIDSHVNYIRYAYYNELDRYGLIDPNINYAIGVGGGANYSLPVKLVFLNNQPILVATEEIKLYRNYTRITIQPNEALEQGDVVFQQHEGGLYRIYDLTTIDTGEDNLPSIFPLDVNDILFLARDDFSSTQQLLDALDNILTQSIDPDYLDVYLPRLNKLEDVALFLAHEDGYYYYSDEYIDIFYPPVKTMVNDPVHPITSSDASKFLQYAKDQRNVRQKFIAMLNQSDSSFDTFIQDLRNAHKTATVHRPTSFPGLFRPEAPEHLYQLELLDSTVNRIDKLASDYYPSGFKLSTLDTNQNLISELPGLPSGTAENVHGFAYKNAQANSSGASTFFLYPEGDYIEDYLRIAHSKYLEYLNLPNNASLDQVTSILADYYQYTLKAHPFVEVNQSMFMNQINLMLESHGFRGLSHANIDLVAVIFDQDIFKPFFKDTVRNAQSIR